MLQEGAHLPYAFAYDKAGGVIVQRGSIARINAADVDRLRMRAVDSGGVRKHCRRGRQRQRGMGELTVLLRCCR